MYIVCTSIATFEIFLEGPKNWPSPKINPRSKPLLLPLYSSKKKKKNTKNWHSFFTVECLLAMGSIFKSDRDENFPPPGRTTPPICSGDGFTRQRCSRLLVALLVSEVARLNTYCYARRSRHAFVASVKTAYGFFIF